MIKTIYLVHHAHTDIGYTDTIPNVLNQHMLILDQVIELCEKYRHLPSGERFKWTIETALVVEEYRKRRTAVQFERLMSLHRDGLVELCGLYSQVLTELPGFPELLELPRFAVDCAKANGFGVRSAMLNDIGGATWMLPEVLASAGIEFFVNGANTFRTLMPWAKELPPLFRWEAPSGRGILFWQFGLGTDEDPSKLSSLHPEYAFGYFDVLWPMRGWYDPVARNYLCDPVTRIFKAEQPSDEQCIQMAKEGIQSLCASAEARGYPYEAIMLQAGADNFPPDDQLCETVQRWNHEVGSPRVVIATPSEFFDFMQQKYGSEIPTLKGEIADPWSDHAGSKAAEIATYRQATRLQREADLFSAMANGCAKQLSADRDETYRNLMMCSEHTYGLNTFAHHSGILAGDVKAGDRQLAPAVASWKLKRQYAETALRIAKQSHARAVAHLTARLAGSTEAMRIDVINADAVTRSGVVEVMVPTREVTSELLCLATNNRIPVEKAKIKGKQTLIRFVANDVPSCGCAQYLPQPSTKPILTARRCRRDPYRLENAHYRIEIDAHSGNVASIYDKSLGREMVDVEANWRFNAYVHEEFVDYPRNSDAAGLVTPAERAYHTTDPASVQVRKMSGIEGEWIEVRSAVTQGPAPARLVQRIVLPKYSQRIEFHNIVKRNPSATKEAIYFAFPFAMDKFAAYVDLAGVLVNIHRDLLDGSTTDFQAIQNVVAMAAADSAVLWTTVDAPLVSIGGMRAMQWGGRESLPEKAHLFSYIMNNTWTTNCPLWQGGTTHFKYAMTSAATLPSEAQIATFGRHFANPLTGVWANVSPVNDSSPIAVGKAQVVIPVERVALESISRNASGNGTTLVLTERADRDGVCLLQVSSAFGENIVAEANGVAVDVSRSNGLFDIYLPMKSREVMYISLRSKNDHA